MISATKPAFFNRVFSAGPTIAETFGKGRAAGNNFDAIRLFAALMVLYAHAFLLTTIDNPTDFLNRFSGGQTGMGDLPIAVFFVLSGFLISQSWLRRPDLLVFARNRIMRIYPCFIVVVLACIFVIGPIVSTLSTEDYFRDERTWRYFLNFTFYFGSDRLPGVFEDAAFLPSVIGPMWTLDFEVACYFVVAVLGAMRFLTVRGCLVTILVCVGVYVLVGDSVASYSENFLRRFAIMGSWFFGGALMAVAGAQIRLNAAFAMTAFFLLVLTAKIGGFSQAFIFCGAYLTMFLGMASLGVLRHVSKMGDFSYGVYLWSWPVQQVAAQSFPEGSTAAVLAVSLPVTILIAALSWHLVEKPALRFKGKGALARLRLSQPSDIAIVPH